MPLSHWKTHWSMTFSLPSGTTGLQEMMHTCGSDPHTLASCGTAQSKHFPQIGGIFMNGFLRNAATLVLLTLITVTAAFSQRNPRATSKVDIAGKFVMIEYGRPSMKGRDLLA